MRVGIHTGKIVAGIIGSKVVRYDIFGEGVIIAQAVETQGIIGKVCVSEDTRQLLLTQPDVAAEYTLTENKVLKIQGIERSIKSYSIEKKHSDSFSDDMMSSEFGTGMESGELGTQGSQKSNNESSE